MEAATANHTFLQPTGEPDWRKGTTVDSNPKRAEQSLGSEAEGQRGCAPVSTPIT